MNRRCTQINADIAIMFIDALTFMYHNTKIFFSPKKPKDLTAII
jgi:hypothetical protein